MRHETLEKLQKQLRPEASIALLVALVVLTVLGLYLYLLKPGLAQYRELAGAFSGAELEQAVEGAATSEKAISSLEREVEDLRSRLYGGASALPLEKMASYVIDRLDQICVRHGVQLEAVTPGKVGRVLMFDELLYDVDVTGDYFSLYAWLGEVEDELRPMAVKLFEMSHDGESEGVHMRLRLVSYWSRDREA